MIVEAALNGDRNLALQALANDPLVHDIDSVPRLLAEMLTANRQFLPLFFQ
jgi:6-phospho-beta-glucosidase